MFNNMAKHSRDLSRELVAIIIYSICQNIYAPNAYILNRNKLSIHVPIEDIKNMRRKSSYNSPDFLLTIISILMVAIYPFEVGTFRQSWPLHCYRMILLGPIAPPVVTCFETALRMHLLSIDVLHLDD